MSGNQQKSRIKRLSEFWEHKIFPIDMFAIILVCGILLLLVGMKIGQSDPDWAFYIGFGIFLTIVGLVFFNWIIADQIVEYVERRKKRRKHPYLYKK